MAASSSSALVSSSSISLRGSFTYEVFLSFRGEDTRKGFTGYLSNALREKGIHAFIDDEKMKAGENIGEALLKAIKESRYCMVILSKRYADSKWCLEELAAMFEHKREKAIIPIFYYVNPSHVRHQRGPFEKAFRNHEVRYNSADVMKWRKAMTKVGQLKGFVFNHQSNKKEVELVEEIVERVSRCCCNNVLPVTDHPVGMDSRVEVVMKLLSIEKGGVKMVGIYGMGGVGKTTLAKEIYNRIQGRFDKAIYIEGIRDGVKKDGLAKLQQQFISKAFKKIKIYCSSEGVMEIKKRFPHKSVLAILDDVDDGDQLKKLAGGCDWFGEGTRILITTRDVQLLTEHPVHEKYQVHELNSSESLHLFSRHAFKTNQPSEEFMEISNKIVEAAGGLPLALEVIGSFLSIERNKEVWEEVETKLGSSGYSQIDKCLRISYDGLSQNEQEGFLDIACFFLGEEKDEVIDIWKGCDFVRPESTINSLLRKCLVKVDNNGRLYMHNLLRDMGRDIGSPSRLWDQKKVWDVLEERKETEKIKAIICKEHLEGEGESLYVVHSLVPSEQERKSVDVEAFANMSKLELLLLGINLKGDFSRMPKSLRSLKWTGCSMQTLSDNFNIQKLGCLKFHFSKIVQFWGDSCISKEKVFTNLKVLDLRDCSALTKLPDFSRSLDLHKLCLQGCSRLADIPESIGRLRKLEHLVLCSCSSLSRLPNSIENLTGLRKLEVSSCPSLLKLPNSIKNFTRLEELSLTSWASFSTLPHFIENFTGLKRLHLSFCKSLSALPNSIGRLTLLEELRLGSCTSLSTLPHSIGNLTGLRKLHLSNCESLSALPYSIKSLTLLEELQLGSCTSLSIVPDFIGNLTRLKRLDLSYCKSVSALPYSIGKLTLLEELELHSCTFLSTLPDSIGNLTGLSKLDLLGCDSLLALPNSIGSLARLEELRVSSARLSTLPPSIENLTRLGSLEVYNCERLSALPNSIGSLTGLQELILVKSSSLSMLPDSIKNLTWLKSLDLSHCTSLLVLPDSIGNMTGLEKLSLASCRRLSTLPSSIGSMRLSTLVLSGSGIKELPDSVRSLKSLEWLGIANCRLRSRLPLAEMKCLKGLVIGGDGDDGDQNNEVCEIPDVITHYSQLTQECKRIRYIKTRNMSSDKVLHLSIWVVGGQERKMKLSWEESWEKAWKWPSLKHFFPDDFTPLYDTVALEACASSSSAPDISEEQMKELYKCIRNLTGYY